MNKELLQTPIQTPIRRISDHSDEEIEKSLKKLTLDFEKVSDFHCNGDEKCAVCLSPFKSEALLKVTKCKHVFHKACLKEAKYKNSSCPLCRTALTPNSNPKFSIQGTDIDLTNPDANSSTNSSSYETISEPNIHNSTNGAEITTNPNTYNIRHPIVQAANRARNAVRLQLLRNATNAI